MQQAVGILLPFTVRTVTIRTIGAQYPGLSGLFASILQVLNLTELGFGSAVVCSMYRAVAEDDEAMLCALMQYYKKIYFRMGMFLLMAGLSVMPFLKLLIHDGYPPDINIYLLYFLYLANTAVSYLLYGYKSALLMAYQRNDVLSGIQVLVHLLVSTGQITVLLLHGTYELFVLLQTAGTVTSSLLVSESVKKMFPGLAASGWPEREVREDIRIRVKRLVIQRLCAVSRNTFDSIFISMFLGLTDIARYGNYYYVMTAVTGILTVFSSSISAGVGNGMILDPPQKNHEDMQMINFLYLWISGCAAVCMLCMYQPFIRYVFGADMLLPQSCAILFCIYFYVLKMGDIRSVYDQAKGLWWEHRYRSLTEAVCNLLLNYLFGKYYGLHGIIAATILTILCVNFLWGSMVIYRYYFKEIPPGTYYMLNLRFGTAVFAAGSISLFICERIHCSPPLQLAAGLVTGFAVSNSLFYLVHRRTKLFGKAGVRAQAWFCKVLPVSGVEKQRKKDRL